MGKLAFLFVTVSCGIALATSDAASLAQPAHATLDAGLPPRMFDCSNVKSPSLRRVPAAIESGSKSTWAVTESKVPGGEDLNFVQWLNAKDGWAGGERASLYRTSSAGKTWRKMKVGVFPPDAAVTGAFFANPERGWVVVTRRRSVYIKAPKDAITWMVYTNDGGKTWSVQYHGTRRDISSVRFANDSEGWAVGGSNDGWDFLILHTSDGGRHWMDVSEPLNSAKAPAPPRAWRGRGEAYNVFVEAPSRAIVLTFPGRRLVYTNDAGKSWQDMGLLPEEPAQSLLGANGTDGIGFLGKNRMWAVGGADSIEGMWGTLAVMNPDCSWTAYTTGGVFLSGAGFLSDTDVLVCGSIPRAGHEMERAHRDGLVLQSTNGGASWTRVFRSCLVPLIRSISVVDSQNVWAVGDKGCILHLRRGER